MKIWFVQTLLFPKKAGICEVHSLHQAKSFLAPYIARNKFTCNSNRFSAMEKKDISEKLHKAKEESIWGMAIADAVSMPVHWYYNPNDIKKSYGGWLTGYRAPNKNHPTSILTISNSGGSGRCYGQVSQQVIGNVILHDKLPYWTSKDRSIHYHQGMNAGDNTLNAVLAVHILITMKHGDKEATRSDKEILEFVMESYVKFMTTPGSHNDTYCESFHRSFFKDWMVEVRPPKMGKDIVKFAGNRFEVYKDKSEDSQVLAIGALVLAIPWIVREAHRSEDKCAKLAVDALKLTHPTPSLFPFVDIYARLLYRVLNGNDLQTEVLKVVGDSLFGGTQTREKLLYLAEEANKHPKGSEKRLRSYQQALSQLGMACYIEGAMSAMLFLAYEFAGDFEAGILTNANCGGENCHRGAALGALLGAASINYGSYIPNKWKADLGVSKSKIEELFDCQK